MAAKKKLYTAEKGKVKLVFQKPAYTKDDSGTSRVKCKELVSVTLQYPQAFDVNEVFKRKPQFKKWSEDGYIFGFDKAKGEPIMKKLTPADISKFLEMKVQTNNKICYYEDRPKDQRQREFDDIIAKEKEIAAKALEENAALRARLQEMEANQKKA